MSLSWRIWWRITALVGPAIALLCAASCWYVLQSHRDHARLTFRNVAALGAVHVERNMLWDDRITVQTFLRRTVEEHPAVIYSFVELDGKPYAWTLPDGVPRDLLSEALAPLDGADELVYQTVDGYVAYDIAVNLPRSRGSLHVGVARRSIDSETYAQLTAIGVGGAITLLLGALLSVVVARRTTREVRTLTAALGESESKFRAISESAQDTIIVTDDKSRVSYWNAAAERVFGWSAEEMQGTVLQDTIVPKRLRSAHEDVFSLILSAGADAGIEDVNQLTVQRRDGTEFPIELSLARVKLGGSWCAVGIARDITERTAMEQDIKDSRQRLELALHGAELGVWDWQIESGELTFNERRAEMLGYEHDELEQHVRSWEKLIHPDDMPAVKRALDAHLNGETEFYESEHRLRHKSGRWIWVLDKGRVIARDPAGRPIRVCGTLLDITERKLAEKSLLLQQAALESTANAIVITNRDGTIAWTNPAFTELTGFAGKEALGQKPSILKSGYQNDTFYRELWETIAAGRVWQGELINKRKDGQLYTEEMTITPVRDAEGQISHFVAIKQDITERKVMEETLMDSEEIYRTLYQMSGDAELLQVDGILIDCNDATLSLFGGLTREEVVGRTLTDLSPLQQPGGELSESTIVEHFSEALQQGRTGFEWAFNRSDTTEFPADVSLTAIMLKGQRTLHVVIRDITERKMAEAAIQRFRAVMNQAQDSVFIIDGESGAILDANDTAAQRLGYPPGQLLQMKYADIEEDCQILPLDAWPTDPDAESGIAPGFFYESVHKRNGGKTLQVEVTVTYRHFDDKPYALAVARDLTLQRKLEAQLRQGQKLEAIGSLAAGIAHEINTPIQFVGDNTRFLSDAFSDIATLTDAVKAAIEGGNEGDAVMSGADDLRKVLEDIDVDYLKAEVPQAIEQSLEGVDRVAGIVRAMKEFSHPGKTTKAPADLNAAIRSTVTVARNEYKYVADLDLDLDESLPTVSCMIGDISQVFLNLIVNAAHAIANVIEGRGDERGRITISTRREDDCVLITIRDTGSGIPEEIRHRVFDPFFTTKGVGKGSGQGLAIAHAVVVDRHHGTLTLESEMGKGTAFHIRLPLEKATEGVLS